MPIRPFTKIRRVKPTKGDPYNAMPIRPRSVVRVCDASRLPAEFKDQTGRIFRIGFYSKQDGLDCIWLVNDNGEYEQTVDHAFLFKYFDILVLSDETNLYGRGCPKIPPVRKAGKGIKAR
jgi:hypothetical protein